jgi:AcrR family transcriptional regulator
MRCTLTKQARSEQTRLQLLSAAAELLRADGYAATSMVDIARAAGVTKGGLYFHFSSKDEICDEVQETAVGLLTTYVERLTEAQPSALRRLADLSRVLMRWLDSEPTVGASFRMAREIGFRDKRFVVFSRAWFTQVMRCVTDARGTGELRVDVPIEVATLLVVVMCVGLETVTSNGTVTGDVDLIHAVVDMWQLISLESVHG